VATTTCLVCLCPDVELREWTQPPGLRLRVHDRGYNSRDWRRDDVCFGSGMTLTELELLRRRSQALAANEERQVVREAAVGMTCDRYEIDEVPFKRTVKGAVTAGRVITTVGSAVYAELHGLLGDDQAEVIERIAAKVVSRLDGRAGLLSIEERSTLEILRCFCVYEVVGESAPLAVALLDRLLALPEAKS
jgi:hypothetical protein